MVVTSTAVHADNPEVVEARQRGVPVIPRAEMLAELMRLKYGIAVAGSHGKTTTTSMVAMVLDRGGLDPTVVVGGRLGVLGSGARLGKGDFMVAEADESDRSFLKLSPTIAVVTNIDREHLDTYRDLADVQDAFVGFVNKVPFYGAAVLCLDDPPVQDILPRVERRVVTYGLSRQAHVSRARRAAGADGRAPTRRCSAAWQLGPIALARAGRAQRAELAGRGGGGPRPGRRLRPHPRGPRRLHRRRPPLPGARRGGRRRWSIDDYGHHPTEIRATLEALRTRAGARRTVVLFQPHRYTRTQHLWDEFCRAFHQADVAAADRHLRGGRGADRGRRPREALAAAIAGPRPPAGVVRGRPQGRRRAGWPRRRARATWC